MTEAKVLHLPLIGSWLGILYRTCSTVSMATLLLSPGIGFTFSVSPLSVSERLESGIRYQSVHSVHVHECMYMGVVHTH